MPIYTMLQDSGFDPELTKAMGEAFDDILLSLGLVDRNDPVPIAN